MRIFIGRLGPRPSGRHLIPRVNDGDKKRITHVITGLTTGGAEGVMAKVLGAMDSGEFENQVISLTELGPLAEDLRDLGISVSALHLRQSVLGAGRFWDLAQAIKQSRPHIVQTWMYHADLLGGIAAKLTTNAPILWNLRQSNFDRFHSKRSSVLTAKTCAVLSHWIPWTIVCGSFSAREIHQDMGYDSTIMQVLPNGFDSERFGPQPDSREKFLAELGLVDNGGPIIGLPARYHPQKDHITFFAAAGRVRSKLPDARFFLCGEGIEESNFELVSLISRYDLRGAVQLLGVHEEIEKFYPAMDVVVLSSAFGEGAPNVLGEAMLCGVPCVATDIGDSSHILGDPDHVVAPENATELADAILQVCVLSEDERIRLGQSNRQRVVDEFPSDLMQRRYEALSRRVFSQCYDDIIPSAE